MNTSHSLFDPRLMGFRSSPNGEFDFSLNPPRESIWEIRPINRERKEDRLKNNVTESTAAMFSVVILRVHCIS